MAEHLTSFLGACKEAGGFLPFGGMRARFFGRSLLGGFAVVGAIACSAPPNTKPTEGTTASVGGQGGVGGTSDAVSSIASTGAGGTMTAGSGGTPSFAVDESVESWHSPLASASVYFAPQDNVETRVLAELAGAKKSLRLAFFNIRLDDVKKLLAAKVKAGVDVHVLLDKKQQDLTYNTMYEDLQAVGVPVTLIENKSAADATLHDKFTVIDGERVVTGSANLSFTALSVSDETVLVMKNAELAGRYEAEFDELVAKGNAKSAPYANEKWRAWMGPEDSLSEKLVTTLDGAKKTAVVAMFDLQLKAAVDALIAAKQRGVNVVVVLDANQANEAGATSDETLAAAGIPVIKALNTGGNQAEMHSKYLVVDHQFALVGSNNWTNFGSYYNDENLVWADDAALAMRLEGNFAELLKAYDAPTPTSLGLVEGTVELTISVANVTLDPGLELQIVGDKNGPFAKPLALNGGSIMLKLPAGTRLAYGYQIVGGAKKMAVELSGKALPHAFTVPYAPGPFTVTDAFVK